MSEKTSGSERVYRNDFVKRLVLAWDPDFTKLTPREAEELRKDMSSETIPAEKIDWDN